jgi:hypothetical protein
MIVEPQSWTISILRSRISRSTRSKPLSRLSNLSAIRSSVHIVRSMPSTLASQAAREMRCLQILSTNSVA